MSEVHNKSDWVFHPVHTTHKVLNDKQVTLNFNRDEAKGKTNVRFAVKEKPNIERKSGVLHRIDWEVKNGITGDKPSLTKKINSFQPKTKRGKLLKATARGANFAVKDVGTTANHVLLASETAAISTSKVAFRAASGAVKNKLRQTATDDTSRMVGTVIGKTMTFRRIHKNRLQAHDRLKLSKKEFRLASESKKSSKATYGAKKKQLKAKKLQTKADFKQTKGKFQEKTATFKQRDSKSNVIKMRQKQRKLQFKQDKKGFKAQKKAVKTDKKLLKTSNKQTKKEFKAARKDLKSAKKGVRSAGIGRQMLKSAGMSSLQKIDESGDTGKMATTTLKGASAAKRGASTAKKAVKKIDSRFAKKKSAKKSTKLRKKKNRLKSAKEVGTVKLKKKKKLNAVNQARKKAERAKRVATATMKVISIASPVIIILIIVALLLMLLYSMLQGIFGNSGWVMGTYTAQDKYLSQAEEYYTKLAFEFNKNILMVGTEDWKKGLENLDVDTSDYDDEVDTWIWGNSTEFNYNPEYDFDPYMLWSFLSAYFYDFEASETAEDSDTDDGVAVKYWKYNGDVEDVIYDLFYREYDFKYLYDNTSHWVELNSYVNDGSYHWTTGSGITNDHAYVTFVTVPSEISSFADSGQNRIYYNMENGEILNYNDNYAATGWYMIDQRYGATDSSGNEIAHFYDYNTSYHQTSSSGGYGKLYYTSSGVPFWIPKTLWSFRMDDGTEFADKFCVEVAPRDVVFWKYTNNLTTGYIGYLNATTSTDLLYDSWDYDILYDTCLNYGESVDGYTGYGFANFYQKYEWVTDVRLYYNVKQNQSFDETIREMLRELDNADERVQMYEMFLGVDEEASTTRGNHQTFLNIDGGSYSDDTVINGYGYDIQAWNTVHCGLAEDGNSHQSLDIKCDSGTAIYAGMDGKIDEIDTDKGLIVIRKDSYNYWYDGDGYGKNRDTKIYYYNVAASSTLSEGDEVNEGDLIGLSMPETQCNGIDCSSVGDYYVHLRVYIDTDGYGWDYIDPRLVLE